jgi:hypothetical protein
MKNKPCSVNQRINGQLTFQRTTEVVPTSGNDPFYYLELFFVRSRVRMPSTLRGQIRIWSDMDRIRNRSLGTGTFVLQLIPIY